MGGSSLASPRGGWRGLFFTNIGDFRELSFIPTDILGKFKSFECRISSGAFVMRPERVSGFVIRNMIFIALQMLILTAVELQIRLNSQL